jgi:hypothetical protein
VFIFWGLADIGLKMYFLAWSIFIKFVIVLIYLNGENLLMIKIVQEITYVDIAWRLSK